MKNSFSLSRKVFASLMAGIFISNQIVWAGEILPQGYSVGTVPPVPVASSTQTSQGGVEAATTLPALSSTDFLGQTSTLESVATQENPEKRISCNPKLTSASVTAVQGSPYPSITEGSSAGTDLSYIATKTQCLLKYSIKNSGDISGFTISFDNIGTSAVESRNLSAISNLTFGLKGPVGSVTFEVMDSQGRKDSFLLSGITSSVEQFWSIPLSLVSTSVDKTRIKQLNFIVTEKNTALDAREGTLSIRVKGLRTAAPAVPTVTSTVPAITNAGTVLLSGTKEANTSILVNGIEVVARNGSTIWTAVVPLSIEGSNGIRITSKNSIGLISAVKTITIKRDTTGPTGSANINSGAVYTGSQTVTVNLSATDKGAGVDKVSFSTDGTNWTSPMAYAASKKILLPSGDGVKTIFVKYYDDVGNESPVYSKSIVLDTLPPFGIIKVNGGVSFISQNTARLDLAASDAGLGIAKMSFSTNGKVWTAAETYMDSKMWAFSSGEGLKTVFVKFQDKTGKWSVPASVTVTLETGKPTGSVNINSGMAYTNSPFVTLNLAATDSSSGIGMMSFSTDSVNWTVPEVFSASRVFALPPGDGTKTLYAKFYDKAGNVSLPYSHSIVLDATPPVVVIDAATPALINSKTFTVSYTSDGVAKQRAFSELAEGLNDLSIMERDVAGNETVRSFSLTVDTTPPDIIFTSSSAASDPVYHLSYTVDGVLTEETRILSEEGDNVLTVTKADLAGNVTQKTLTVKLSAAPGDTTQESAPDFSLTTANGEVLNYLNGKLNEVTLADGSVAKQFQLDQEGNLLSALAEAMDGSLEFLDSGNRLIYRRPDGSHAYYEGGLLSKIITREGLTILYSYLKDTLGNILETVAESDLSCAIYDAGGKLKTMLDKTAGKTTQYENGILEKVVSGDGGEVVYERTLSQGEFLVAPVQTSLRLAEYTLLKYDAASFALKEAHARDGRIFLFENGQLTHVTDASGNMIEVNLTESELSNITDLEISHDGLSASYDAESRLNRITMNDLVIHYKADSNSIDYVEKNDGTELHELVFASNGTLTGAVIVDPQGVERTYHDGKLVQVVDPDTTKIFFDNDQITKLITPEQLTYHFDYTSQGITASLDAAQAAIPSAVVRMDYDLNMNLKRLIRQNQEIISFAEDRPFIIEAPGEAVKVYSYETDALGKVISTHITQGHVETFLDEQNQPVRSLIHATAAQPDSYEVIYRYGKIREIYKNGTLAFRYSYQFNASGMEQTVIDDLGEGAIKIYQDDSLLTSFHKETSVLSSYVYDGDRVSKVSVSRFGRMLHTYSYAYSGEDTLVTDEAGAVRTYNRDHKLSFLERDGEKFSYGYFLNNEGKEIIEEKLIECTLTDGSRAHYDGKNIAWIDRQDGSRLDDLKFDGDGQLIRVTVTLESGVKKIISEDKVLEQIDPDGTHFYFENNRLVKMLDASGKEFTYRYDNQPDGSLINAWVKDQDHYFEFDATGTLKGIKLLDIADGIDGATAFSDAGTSHLSVTGSGNAQLDTAENRFGWASGKFDGSGDFLVSPDNQAFDFSGGVWTMDFWMKKDSYNRNEVVYAQVQEGDEKIFIGVGPGGNGGGSLYMQYETDMHDSQPVITIYTAKDVLIPGQWQHVAIVQNGRNFYIFVDGVLAASSPQSYLDGTWPLHMNDYASEIQIGSGTTFNGRGQNGACGPDFTGWIDDFRVSNGIARWTGNFDVPQGSFTPDAYTKFFLNFETTDRSYYALNTQTDANGRVTGYVVSGYKGVFGFGLAGNYLSGSDPVVASQLTSAFTSMFALSPKVYENRFSGFDPNVTGWFSTAQRSIFAADTVIAQEYSVDGVLETQTRADKTVTLFEDNKPVLLLDEKGNVLIEYSYDADGNPTRVFLKNARAVLPEEVAKAKMRVEEERAKALLQIAEAKRLAYENIKSQADTARAQLSSQISRMEQQIRDLEGTKVYGSKNKKAKSNALDQARNVLAQARGQWAEIHRQEADAYARLDQEAQAASNKAEADAQAAFTEIDKQEADLKREILYQEISPVIYHYYRKTLGRDPGQAEYQYWLDRVDYHSGETNVEIKTLDGTCLIQALKTYLVVLPELAEREAYVANIKQKVSAEVTRYLNLSLADRQALATSLGLSSEELITLTSEDAGKILGWLNSRPLHFGQSAFLALESLFDQKGITYSREDIAVKTILIDIFTGVISPLDDSDLILSVYALNKTASLYGLALAGAKLSYDDLKSLYDSICGASAATCGFRLVAHINGNHFVVVTAVTADSVTYIDMGIGRDKQNESVTVSKEGFLKAWKGFVTGEEAVVRSVIPAEEGIQGSHILNRSEAQNVRGAFFGSLLSLIGVVLSFTPLAPLTIPILVAGFVTSLIEGDWMAAISSVVSIAFIGFDVGSIFNGVFSGIKDALGGVGQFFGNMFNSVTGYLGRAIDLLPGFSTAFSSRLAADIVNVSIFAGVSYGVSKGLVVAGVSPEIAGFASSLVTGAMLGGMSKLTSTQVAKGLTQSDLIRQNALGIVTMQNVGSLGRELHLDPRFTSLISLSLGAIQGSIIQNPGSSLEKVFKDVMPTLDASLAYFGIDKLGTSLGLPASISGVIGATFSSVVGQLTDGLVNSNGGGGPGSIFNTIKSAVFSKETLGGVFSIGAGIVMNSFGFDNSLLPSLSSRLIAGVFNDFVASPKRFSLTDSIIKSTDESFYQFFDPMLLPQLLTSIGEEGFSRAVDQYATTLFTRETIEEFASSGINLGQWIEKGLPAADDVIYEGEAAKKLTLTQNGKTIDFVYEPKGKQLELWMIGESDSAGNQKRIIELVKDDNGKILNVKITQRMPDGTFRIDLLDPNGRIKEVTLNDWSGDTYGKLSFNTDGDIEFTNYNLGISEHLSPDGRLQFDFTAAPDFQDMNQLLYDFNINHSREDIAQLSAFTFGNGFWNSHQSPDAVSALMATYMKNLASDQAKIGAAGIVLFEKDGSIARDRHGNILTTSSIPVTLYEETGLLGNILRWVAETWMGSNAMRNEVEREMTRYLDLLDLNKKEFNLPTDMPFVHFAHSGDFQPFIKALEHMDKKYQEQVKTLIVYEGPYVGDGIINDPCLQTLIRVRGTPSIASVPLLDHRTFSLQDENGNVMSIPNQYNIEIKGAGHSDFSYDPNFNYANDEAREIARKTSIFMRDLNMISSDKDRLKSFLSGQVTGVKSREDGVIEVDPRAYQSIFGDR